MPTKPLHRLKPDNLPQSSNRRIQRLWILKENNILKKYWKRIDVDMTRQQLCDMFHHRTWGSISSKAKRLSMYSRYSINHKRKYWTLKEDNILKKYWTQIDVDMTREELCNMLDHRTWESVRNRATRLFLPLPRNTRFQSSSVNYEILEQMDRRIKI